MNCELNSEPVFANLPIKKLSKTQRNRVSLQFTDRVFGTRATETNSRLIFNHWLWGLTIG